MSHNRRWSGSHKKAVKRFLKEKARLAKLPRQKPLEEIMANLVQPPVLAILEKK